MKTNEEAAAYILARRNKHLKKRKTVIVSTACAIIVVICVTVINFSALNKDPDRSAGADKKIYFPTHSTTEIDGDFIDVAETIPELYDKSELVVIAYVTDAYDYKYNDNLTLACSKVKISKVIKGNLKEGDEISIEETGCRKDIEVSIGGVPLLDNNMKVILFLTQPSDISQGFPAYGIIDGVVGKFFYDNEGYIHHSSEFSDEPLFKLKDIQSKMKEKEFLKLIQ